MKYLSVIFLLSLVFTIKTCAQIIKCKEGSVSFYSEAPIENIDAISKNLNSFINLSGKSIAYIIPIRTFAFKRQLMQEHFNEKYMESDKYPNATFNGIINEDIDLTKNGSYKVTASGKLNIHGVENPVTVPGTLIVKDGTIQITSEFMVAIKDYKIKIPVLLFKNIAENILVKINALYTP